MHAVSLQVAVASTSSVEDAYADFRRVFEKFTSAEDLTGPKKAEEDEDAEVSLAGPRSGKGCASSSPWIRGKRPWPCQLGGRRKNPAGL